MLVVHDRDRAGRYAFRRAADLHHAAVFPHHDSGQPQIRHREARGSEGQARRRAGISADRGAMDARRAAARIRRAAEGHGILDGAHAGKKPRRRHRLQAAARRRRASGARRFESRRDDARRRARCHGALSVRPQPGGSQPRRSRAPSRFQISVPRPGRGGHPLLPQDRDFPDQSPGRGAARHLREGAVGGVEPAQGLQQGKRHRQCAAHRARRISPRHGATLRRCQHRLAAPRRQSQPQGDGDHRAIFAGAGADAAADQDRRALRAERAGVVLVSSVLVAATRPASPRALGAGKGDSSPRLAPSRCRPRSRPKPPAP